MLPAARDFDRSSCPRHGKGQAAAVQTSVIANVRRLVTVKCSCVCMGPPDYVVTGSGTVLVTNHPAARATDKTMHGGVVAVGSGNVLIGGPRVGATVGAPGRGRSCCEDLKKGRKAGSAEQGYNNCGVEASRLLIRGKKGSAPSESDLLEEAIRHDNASDTHWKQDPETKEWKKITKGGSTAEGREGLLERHGVESEQVEQTPDAIVQAVAEGKGVITSHDAGTLWDDPRSNGEGHGVVVTGVEFDAEGKPVNFITVDSGIGSCAAAVPADRFLDSMWKPPATANVTKEPLWPGARRSP